jgi:hypothetical protein
VTCPFDLDTGNQDRHNAPNQPKKGGIRQQLTGLYRFVGLERFLVTKSKEEKLMKHNWPKMTVVLVALVVGVFIASSAMAINLNSRSEEMTAFSDCDLGGTITLTFTESDYNTMMGYLGGADPNADTAAGTGTANAVIIRVSLSGTDIAPDADVPLLCEPIAGTAAPNGAAGTALPIDMVAIETIDVEVSDMSDGVGGGTDGTPDVTAFVIGPDGAQYFTIYITDIQRASNWADENTFPWIKVGLYQDLIDALDLEHTAICADVHDFGGLSKLTVSLQLTPATLTYTTADNQIGHFLVEQVDLRACNKDEQTLVCDTTEEIELCPREPGPGQSAICDDNTLCFAIDGDIPPSGIASFELRSNGAADGDNTQSGVYIRSVAFANEAGGAIAPTAGPSYWMADGTTAAGTATCDDESEQARAEIDLADIAAAGDELLVCVTYQVNPDEAAADTDVMFWVDFFMPPCGTIITDSLAAASLVECGGVPSCMYFQYVLSGMAPWYSGIAVTNLGTTVAPADMVVTFTLTDSTGATFTYTKSDFTGVVWAAFLDDILPNFSGTPAPGPAWLLVQANFSVDGYEFVTDGVFGGSTNARLMTSCP